MNTRVPEMPHPAFQTGGGASARGHVAAPVVADHGELPHNTLIRYSTPGLRQIRPKMSAKTGSRDATRPVGREENSPLPKLLAIQLASLFYLP